MNILKRLLQFAIKYGIMIFVIEYARCTHLRSSERGNISAETYYETRQRRKNP